MNIIDEPRGNRVKERQKKRKSDKIKFATTAAFRKVVRDVSEIVAFLQDHFCNARDKTHSLRRKRDFPPSRKIFFSSRSLARPKGASRRAFSLG